MKERRLVELISLPQPKAGRFELRTDGGTTLILEMDLLTQDGEISKEEFVVSHSIEIDPIGLEEILFPLFFPLEPDD